jgi:type I restriction enzyme S subunit
MSVVGMPGFTETEIGWIPTDWSIQSVASLSNVDSESLSNKTAADFTFRYISLGDVDAAKLIGGHSLITFAEAPSRARRIVKSGDILFATVRPNLKGHFFARRVDGNVVASTGFAVIRAKAGVASPAFLYQSLLSGNVDAQIEKLTVGSNYPAVNSADVKGLLLPAPPLPEQQKIAAILTAVDDKLGVIARQIEATQTLKQGLMQTLFSRGVGTQDANGRWVPHAEFKDSELGEIPASWDVAEIQSIAEVIRGASPRPQGDLRYYGGDVPRLMGADVTRDGKWVTPQIDFLTQEGAKRSRPCPKGTLTIICSGDVGIPSFLAVDACIHDGFLALINIDEVSANKNYLYHVISSLKQRLDASATHGGVFTNLTTTILKEFRLPLPSIAEQEKIAAALDAVDDKLAVAAKRHQRFQTLKRGLMQKLLTGEWRVNLDASATGT